MKPPVGPRKPFTNPACASEVSTFATNGTGRFRVFAICPASWRVLPSSYTSASRLSTAIAHSVCFPYTRIDYPPPTSREQFREPSQTGHQEPQTGTCASRGQDPNRVRCVGLVQVLWSIKGVARCHTHRATWRGDRTDRRQRMWKDKSFEVLTRCYQLKRERVCMCN
jgi:hypothetical protein